MIFIITFLQNKTYSSPANFSFSLQLKENVIVMAAHVRIYSNIYSGNYNLAQTCCLTINIDLNTRLGHETFPPSPLPHSLHSSSVENKAESWVVCKLGEPPSGGLTIQALPFRWAGTFSLIHHRKKLHSLVASTAGIVVIFSQMCVEQARVSFHLISLIFWS